MEHAEILKPVAVLALDDADVDMDVRDAHPCDQQAAQR